MERKPDCLPGFPIPIYCISLKGIGVVPLAVCLGETGDPMRFHAPRQLSRLAGYNLIEDSSGKNESEPASPSAAEKACAAYFTKWH